jgi:hypothetical protein
MPFDTGVVLTLQSVPAQSLDACRLGLSIADGE